MDRFKILILTDHRNHSKENSLYALARTLSQHPSCTKLDIATRANPENDDFFIRHQDTSMVAVPVENDFGFDREGSAFSKKVKQVFIADYDAVWLRLPPPLSASFLTFLEQKYPNTIFINHPMGIFETGSKAFLMNFQSVCPAMQICHSITDIEAFAGKFSKFVLKPFREYGGKGIVKIDGQTVEVDGEKMRLDDFYTKMKSTDIKYLAVKFLENVSKGDKRIIVVNGKIMGASLRLPAEGSWLCNVAAGGHSVATQVTELEEKIIEHIHPKLSEMGIVMYGADLLTGDDGQPVLSEINTTSIGGIPQLEIQQKKLLVLKTINEIIKAIKTQKK